MLSVLLSLWSQYLHFRGLTLLWVVCVCLNSLNLFANIFPHWSHSTLMVSLNAALSSSVILQNFSCLLIPLTSTPQLEQVASCPCFIFMWFFKANTDAEHIWHWLFCCVCVRLCSFRRYLLTNDLEQTSQMCVFSPWFFMWTFKTYLFLNVFEQTSHRATSEDCLTFSFLGSEFLTLILGFELFRIVTFSCIVGYLLVEVESFSSEAVLSKTKDFTSSTFSFSCLEFGSGFTLGRRTLVLWSIRFSRSLLSRVGSIPLPMFKGIFSIFSFWSSLTVTPMQKLR